MFALFIQSNPELRTPVSTAHPFAKWFCLVLACLSFEVWSQKLPQDDGSCDISDFLCPVPGDLTFNSTNEQSCHFGEGYGSMTNPVSNQSCLVSTFSSGSYNNGHLCAADEGQVCGEIRCPYGCYPDSMTPPCQCYARWLLCYKDEQGGGSS